MGELGQDKSGAPSQHGQQFVYFCLYNRLNLMCKQQTSSSQCSIEWKRKCIGKTRLLCAISKKCLKQNHPLKISQSMALTLPLHLFDGICRLLPPFTSSHPSTSEQQRLASTLAAHCSIFDQIRWRRVSKSFKRAIDARLRRFTRIDVRCYNGLAQMCEESGGGRDYFEWHPHATLMVLEMGPHELGIAVDTKMRPEDVKALIQLLCTFRRSVAQLCMDSPIIELLVSQINRQQMNILLDILKSSRTVISTPSKSRFCSGSSQSSGCELVSNTPQNIPYGPFFPNLKKLTITSQSNQLEHLSRLLSYAVGVDFLYETSNIDLLCLKICIGTGLWTQKPNIRLFRHVTRFRQWTEAGSLGERYFQQFTGASSRPKLSRN